LSNPSLHGSPKIRLIFRERHAFLSGMFHRAGDHIMENDFSAFDHDDLSTTFAAPKSSLPHRRL
jgi:hypothetical protein